MNGYSEQSDDNSRALSQNEDGRPLSALERPPFNAEAVRMAALEHARRYNLLLLPALTDHPNYLDSNSSLTTRPDIPPDADDKDRAMRLQIVRGLLLNDLKELLQGTSYLEQMLLADRSKIWIAHGVISLGMFSFISTPALRRFLETRLAVWLPVIAQLVTYPVAVFRVANHERCIYGAHAVRKGLGRILDRVQSHRSVNEDDLKCLDGWVWDSVPWGELEYGKYAE
ncbi:hypothetical protein MMC30_003911 [Trapelia coarctata]|nr:hypothetical protein [Trapelia coarctata]